MDDIKRVIIFQDGYINTNRYDQLLKNTGLNYEFYTINTIDELWHETKVLKPHIIIVEFFHLNLLSSILAFLSEQKAGSSVIILAESGLSEHENAFISAGASAFLKNDQINKLGVLVKDAVQQYNSSERKSLEIQLRYLAEFEKLISTLAATLINASCEKIDGLISNSLRLLARYLNADKAIIGMFSKQGLQYVYKWESVSVQKSNTSVVSNFQKELPWFYAQLKNHAIVYIKKDNIPSEAQSEKMYLQKKGIKSLIYIPLIVQAQAVGLLGFECFKVQTDTITPEIIKMLRVAGAMFVNAMQRQKTERALIQSESRYRAIFENTGTAMIIADSDFLINMVNTKFCQLTGYSQNEIEGKMKLQEFIFEDDYELLKEYHESEKWEHYGIRIVDKRKNRKDLILHFAQIPDASQTVISFIDISAQVQIEKRLRELNASKTEFVSMASHELRTPLTGIIGLTQTLLSEDIDITEDEKKRFLQIIEAEGNRLSLLLSELLDLTKIETGTSEFSPTNLNIAELINETLKVIPIPSTISLNIITPPDHDVYGRADHDRIKQVLVNLLDNAIRYSKQTGCITISVQEQQSTISIAVSDKGTGINKEEIPKVFDKFYRSKAARKIVSKGTGLGLTIAKNIVEAHGGHIWVKSQEGQGATFIFTLPKGSQ